MIRRIVRRAIALAALSMIFALASSAQQGRQAEREVKEPVTLVSLRLLTQPQVYTVMEGVPAGQPRIRRDLLTSRPVDLLQLRVRNDDPARTIEEIEYQLYRVVGSAEVGRLTLSERVRIRPGRTSSERSLRWNADALGCGRAVSACSLSVRVLRVKYADGTEWTHPLRARQAGGSS